VNGSQRYPWLRAEVLQISISLIDQVDAIVERVPRQGFSILPKLYQFEFPRLAGGTMPFIRRYSTIWP
jgi:hypothetical protein